MPALRPTTIATLFLLSTVVGMATLAVYAAALGPLGYTDPYYWADFATPGELFLVFGAFASWSALRSGQSGDSPIHRRARPERSGSAGSSKIHSSWTPVPRGTHPNPSGRSARRQDWAVAHLRGK